jgi:cell shape-determining protein MreC
MFIMKKEYIGVAILLVASVLIFFFRNSSPVKFLGSAVEEIFLLPKEALYSLKTKIVGDDSAQIKKLKQENAAIAAKLIDYNKTKRDNDALRSQFETAQTQTYKLLPARVIGFLGNFSAPSTLIIDQGESSGIKSGAAVIFQNNLIGKIGSVSSSYSQVILPQNSKFSALGATSENNSLGIIRGQEDFILFDHVSINDKLTPGETVLTKSEINETGPGKVSGVVRRESQPFQTAKIESALDTAHLTTVFVALN